MGRYRAGVCERRQGAAIKEPLMRARSIMVTGVIALAVVGLSAPAAYAQTPKPAKSACSNGADKYACLEVDRRKAPVGETVTFTGTLSKKAMTNLKSWTGGTNVVCLDRYPTKPLADGGWPRTPMEGACTSVRTSGDFTIEAEFGRVGKFNYGVSMGPCRASADECGNADPGLVGVGGDTVVRVRTTR
jgi:hypothetical protein